MEKKKERVEIFIDAGNFHHSTKNARKRGFEVDLRKIINELSGDREVKTFYYIGLLDPDYNLEKYEEQKQLIENLKKIHNFKVVLCDMRKTKMGNEVKYEIKGDDIYLAHDLLLGAFDNLYEVAIIVSGDADFIPVINTLRKRFKKKIGNAYFRRTSSFKLRKACDFSVNLNKLIRRLNAKKE